MVSAWSSQCLQLEEKVFATSHCFRAHEPAAAVVAVVSCRVAAACRELSVFSKEFNVHLFVCMFLRPIHH